MCLTNTTEEATGMKGPISGTSERPENPTRLFARLKAVMADTGLLKGIGDGKRSGFAATAHQDTGEPGRHRIYPQQERELWTAHSLSKLWSHR